MDINSIICELFPFKGIKEQSLQSIIDDIHPEICEFSRGDIIFSPSSYQEKIGFVIDGECEVGRPRADDDSVLLNLLTRYSSFGILAILAPAAEFPTLIRARKKSKILFIPGKDMISVIKRYPTVAMNVISFLAERISFLNRRIATFSGKTVEEKLASYLLSHKSESAEIPLSGTKIASAINVGRASLYRTLDSFESSGIIILEDKKIIIKCPEGLERILK